MSPPLTLPPEVLVDKVDPGLLVPLALLRQVLEAHLGDLVEKGISVIAISCTSEAKSDYKPYGTTYGPYGTATFEYTEKPTDSTTGLHYSGAGFYEAASGKIPLSSWASCTKKL